MIWVLGLLCSFGLLLCGFGLQFSFLLCIGRFVFVRFGWFLSFGVSFRIVLLLLGDVTWFCSLFFFSCSIKLPIHFKKKKLTKDGFP